MMVHTSAAVVWANENDMNIKTIINETMVRAQLSFDNSLVAINVNLAHTYEVDYMELGIISTDLDNLTFGSIAGFIALHGQFSADLVAMFTKEEHYGGTTWYMNNLNGSNDHVHSITRVQQAWFTTSHAHEMVHNMGSAHSGSQSVELASDGNLLQNYSAGWRWTGNNGRVYISVITYQSDEDSVTPVEYFSNPDVLYQGVPTGSYAEQYATTDNAYISNSMRAHTAPEGNQTYCWSYEKDNTARVGLDHRWLDTVAFVVHNTSNVDRANEIACRFVLYQNYPNPFNPTTSIQFSIPQSTHIWLEVYTLLGECVFILVNGMMNICNHSVFFDGKIVEWNLLIPINNSGTFPISDHEFSQIA